MLLNRLMPDSYLDLEIKTITEKSRLILGLDFEKHSSSISALNFKLSNFQELYIEASITNFTVALNLNDIRGAGPYSV